MKGFCRKMEKFVEIYSQFPGSYCTPLTCSGCGIIDTKEKTDDHVFDLPDWFVEYVEGRFADSWCGY